MNDPVLLQDLLDYDLLDEMVDGGFVRQQVDPTGELAILNYTEQAVYTRTWNDVTRQCRGLIYRRSDREVLARPFAKFFNYGEHTEGTLDLTAAVEVTDKEDGSLGILYTAPNGRPAIATRGSFTSEQALHATALYRERYEGKWMPDPTVTYLFEIVYRANRIVRDYGDMDDLILIGGVDIETGAVYGAGNLWVSDYPDLYPGPLVEQFPYRTLADALAAEPRPGAEGLVVRYIDGEHKGTMVKIKQDDYVALHRIVTGLTARRIWERLAVWDILDHAPATAHREIGQRLRMDVNDVGGIVDAGPDWRETIKRTAPEEFTDWIDGTVEDLTNQLAGMVADVTAMLGEVRPMVRKDAAAHIAKHPLRGLIFAALDGKSYRAQAWGMLRPDAERPFRTHGEDVA